MLHVMPLAYLGYGESFEGKSERNVWTLVSLIVVLPTKD